MSRDMAKGFLADICANVEDDTPRLVYADWLEDHGQPERAELIRVQIERTRLPKWDAAQVRLRVREEALIATHGAAWRAAIPKLEGVGWGGFRRGFVAQASLASFALLREAAWRDVAPVEAVAVRWPKKGEADALAPIPGLRELAMAGHMVSTADADRLSACRLLSTLRVLDITGCAVGVGGLERVVSSPHLGRLEALRAADNGIGDGIAGAFNAGPANLPELEELDLSESGDAGYYGVDVFTAEGFAALGAWPGMARIRRLDLSGHGMQEDQILPLLRSPLAAGLKELTLHNTHNYRGWGYILAEAHPDLALDALDIGDNLYRGDAGVLADNPRLAGLKELRIDDIHMEDSPDDLRDLASGRFMSGLRVLRLERGEAGGSDGLQAILAAPAPHLHTLSLRDAYIEDGPIIALAASPASNTLLELDLTGNQLRSDAARALGETKHLQSLLVLRVGGNPMSKKEEDAIAASPLGRRLMLLDRSER